MNKKGFTLIELLAVVVIIGILTIITVPLITDTYENSKLKNEEIFKDKLSDVLKDYIILNSGSMSFEGSSEKIKNENGKEYTVTVSSSQITFNDIINSNYLTKGTFVNPGTGKDCDVNAKIEVYKDSEYVYCHKVKKVELKSCLSEKYYNSIKEDYLIDTCSWSEK